jgi:hypothetical protein
MAMKMKKKQKNSSGTSPAPHPRVHAGPAGDRNKNEKSPDAGFSGISRSFSGLLDRTRAYFRPAEKAES